MMSAMVRIIMAAIAQVLRAQRVWSIHVEKDTSFLGKIWHKTQSIRNVPTHYSDQTGLLQSSSQLNSICLIFKYNVKDS